MTRVPRRLAGRGESTSPGIQDLLPGLKEFAPMGLVITARERPVPHERKSPPKRSLAEATPTGEDE